MGSKRMRLAAVVAVAGVGVAATAIAASSRNASGDLRGFDEVPAVSSTGDGEFTGRRNGDSVDWELSYSGLEGNVLQAHVHFGQRSVNGGIAVWLCSNLSSPPTPAGFARPCPPSPATISGTFDEDDVVGPPGQGIAPGEYDELLAAIEAGVAYANVHTDKHTGGEIRGQLRPGTSSN